MKPILLATLSMTALAGLSGCASYTSPNTNQFYLSLDYTPLVSALAASTDLTAIKRDNLARPRNPTLDTARGCDELGVLPRLPVTAPAPAPGGGAAPADVIVSAPSRTQGLVVRPGMKLEVAQVAARATAASETPQVSTWSWTVPRAQNAGCPSAPLSRQDILIERGLLYGARWAVPNPAPGTPPPPGKLLWQGLIRAAVVDGGSSEAKLRERVFDPVADRLYVAYRDPDLEGAEYRPPQPASRYGGLARAFLAICGLRFDDLSVWAEDTPSPAPAPSKPDRLTDCADPAKWTGGAAASPPSNVCGRLRKSLQLDLVGSANADARLDIPKSKLSLLSDGDDLFLTQPRAIPDMAEGAFDLRRPISGDAQMPVYGEAYAGFVDFDIRIPVRVSGEATPRWVPACTTVSEFKRTTGLTVALLKRPAYWVDQRVSVIRDKDVDAKPLDQKLFRDRGNRVRFNFDRPRQGSNSIYISSPDDFLLAPGDQLTLEP